MAGGLGLRRGGAVRPEPGARISAAFGGAPVGDPYAMADLRRQQADFAKVRREIDKQNAWLAVPALAPVAAVLALEGAGALAAALAVPQARRPPLDLPGKRRPARGGETEAAAIGRRAHADINGRAKHKPGWDSEYTLETEGGRIRLDLVAPARNPLKPEKRFQLELKPNTPSGRRAEVRDVKRYTELTGNKTRAIYYNPKDYK